MSADEARTALRDLTDVQLRAALMCWWVKDPTPFWKAIEAAAGPPHEPGKERTPGHHSTCTCHLCEMAEEAGDG